MYLIPTDQVPNQEFKVILDSQNCTIHIYQRVDLFLGEACMYMDVYVDSDLIRQGQKMIPKEPILTEPHGMAGNFYIVDTYASDDYQKLPDYEGLGERWKLYWLDDDELAELEEYRDEEAGL